MRFPPVPAQFTDRVTCVGTLSSEDRTTGPLDILIDVSTIAAHGIRGWVLGNKASRDDIERAQGRYRGAMRLNARTGSEALTSESIWVMTTQSFGADRGTMPHGLHGIACAFDCLDLTRRLEHAGDVSRSREVRFLLRGPRVRGLVSWTHEFSFEGTNKVAVRGGGRVATGGGLPFSVSVLPHFVHDGIGARRTVDDGDETVADGDITSETNVLAMVCRTRKAADRYGDAAFLADARQAVGDMCLLLSLLAGGMITWHAYLQDGSGSSLRYDRSLGSAVGGARPEGIIQPWQLRDFLSKAFRRLRKLRADGIDLEMPIVSAVAGAQARVARQRFGEFFLALEALHSLHVQNRGETLLVEKATFRRVREELKMAIGPALRREGVRSPTVSAQMVAKLGELNRPPLWKGLTSLMRRLRVDWRDLYPEPGPERPAFLGLRNSLFHSHSRAADETVLEESIRVEVVVHRVLLRWLGWEGLWNAPSVGTHPFVSGGPLRDSPKGSGNQRKHSRRRANR